MEASLVNWTSAPNLRGTAELLWFCLFTCFVRTWTILHLNVPQHNSRAKWRWWYKVRTTCDAVLAPEYVAGIAFTELRTALLPRQHMKKASYENWTVKHGFFVALGGCNAFRWSNTSTHSSRELYQVAQEMAISWFRSLMKHPPLPVRYSLLRNRH